MKRIYFKLREESLESQKKAKRRTPFLEITFKDSLGFHTHTVCAGVHDVIFGFSHALKDPTTATCRICCAQPRNATTLG